MKKQSLFSRVRHALSVALRYWHSHAEGLHAIKKLYAGNFIDEKSGEIYKVLLGVNPHGRIFRISQVYYRGGVYSHETSWLATYRWHCNGHLIAVGENGKYLILNPAHQSVSLERYNDADEKKTELYQQI
jgi:hypothetical protein